MKASPRLKAKLHGRSQSRTIRQGIQAGQVIVKTVLPALIRRWDGDGMPDMTASGSPAAPALTDPTQQEGVADGVSKILCPDCQHLVDIPTVLWREKPTALALLGGEPLSAYCRRCDSEFIIRANVTFSVGSPAGTGTAADNQGDAGSLHEGTLPSRSEAS